MNRFAIAGPGWEVTELTGVIFDKDGTLIDLHRYWGEVVRRRSQAVITEYRLRDSDLPQLCESMGFDVHSGRLLSRGPVGLASREEVVLALQAYLASVNVETEVEALAAVFNRVHQDFLKDVEGFIEPLAGVRPFLAALHALGARMAVVTSDTVGNTRRSLDATGLAQFFDTIIGHDSTPERKTSGVPAKLALDALGCEAASTVCVGDAPMDMTMAARSGCKACIGVATGQMSETDLLHLTPYTSPSFAALTCTTIA